MFNHLYLLPIVGLVKGGVVILPLTLALLLDKPNPYLTTFGVIALHFISQGFLHADGLIDFSEAVLAYRFGVEGYKVVKDRYRGSYAIATFSIYILGLFSAIVVLVEKLPVNNMLCLLMLNEVWSIITMIILSYIGKEAPEGFGKTFKHSLESSDVFLSLTISSILTLVMVIALGVKLRFLIAITISVILSLSISRSLAHRVLGFVNGDVLGFSSELYYLISMIFYWVSLWI